MGERPSVRFRVDFAGRRSIGIGKIELLERIAVGGSIARAARDMNMSYRRAWLLLEDMNLSFDRPVTTSSTGGKGGGGVKLTTFGQRLIKAYRGLEAEVAPLIDVHFKELNRRVKSEDVRHKVVRSPLSKRVTEKLKN